MKPMPITIRPIGNSQGIVIPKPLLAQLGIEGTADMTIEQDALVLRKPRRSVRAGWAAAAKQLAESEDDALLLGEFANEDDSELIW
jgi:antitoxin MazE